MKKVFGAILKIIGILFALLLILAIIGSRLPDKDSSEKRSNSNTHRSPESTATTTKPAKTATPSDPPKNKASGAKTTETSSPTVARSSNPPVTSTPKATPIAETAVPIPPSFTLCFGEPGDFGVQITMNESTIWAYYVPGGKYSVSNIGDSMAQLSIYAGTAKKDGRDVYTESTRPVLLLAGKSNEIEVPDGWFIILSEKAKVSLTRE